jgi:hypothetical protein
MNIFCVLFTMFIGIRPCGLDTLMLVNGHDIFEDKMVSKACKAAICHEVWSWIGVGTVQI